MPERVIGENQLSHMEFLHRENQLCYTSQDADRLQYELLSAADPRAVEEGEKAFRARLQRRLSEDDLRSCKYLFVANAALCCRCCVESGLRGERAYNICDLFIQKMDALETEQEIIALHKSMVEFYLEEMSRVKKQRICSRPVAACMDYIGDHLHEQIPVSVLAARLELNQSYLSVLFKKETGMTISDYIRQRRVEAAEGMLRYSSYSCSDIGNYLSFCSQSHFISVFRKATGMTPRQYRTRFGSRESLKEPE